MWTVDGVEMKILVPVKRLLDYNVKRRVKADGTGVDLANVKMIRGCAIRLEERSSCAKV